jgi:hypothetical protein
MHTYSTKMVGEAYAYRGPWDISVWKPEGITLHRRMKAKERCEAKTRQGKKCKHRALYLDFHTSKIVCFCWQHKHNLEPGVMWVGA